MDVYELVSALTNQGIRLQVIDDKLNVKAKTGTITPELQQLIGEKRHEIIQLLIRISEKFDINVAPQKEYYALSSAQQRMYFLHKFDKTSLAYNIPEVVLLEGTLDREQLRETFERLIMRHESLRTSFTVIDEVPVQRVLNHVNFDLEYFESIEQEEVSAIIDEFIRPFDLSEGPLIRAGLILKTKPNATLTNQAILMVDMHHIIADGVSHGVLINDFASLYCDELLPAISLQYKDYAEWQQSEVQQAEIKLQRDFWINLFGEDISTTDLPSDFKRPMVKSHQGRNIGFKIGSEETQKLKLISDKTGSTMFMIILSIIYVLISKLTNQEDIVIGTPVSGRPRAELNNIIGMFVNTLPLRNYPKWNMSFREFLATVKSNTLKCFDNQSYQYEALLDELKVERDTSRNPLFDVMYAHRNFEDSVLEIPGMTISSYANSHEISKFDLTIYTTESKEGILVNFEYSTDLFKAETIERFAGYFQKIVSSVVEDTNAKLSTIEILSEEEKHQMTNDFNNTSRNYLINKPIHQLFEEQVRRTPDHIALVFEKKKLSYHQVNIIANGLAKELRSLGVKPNDLVCIVAGRSMEMIIGMLSILKSGAAFLPIDPDLPLDRINYMIKDSGSSVLLSRSELVANLNYKGAFLDLEDLEKYEDVENDLLHVNKVEDLAYVIYTSGSTGKPKGVMVEHKSLVNLCCWHNESYGISSKDNSTKYAGFGFDASVWETFPYLIAGGCLHIISDEIRLNVMKLNAYYETHGITMSFLPTQVFEQFIELKNDSLRYLLTGGDKLITYRNCNYSLVNNYGPTENTVVTTSFNVIDSNQNIPIGKPISNSKVYVLNERSNLVPIGVPGELYVSGDGLARGYLNNQTLTLEKFVEDPFNTGERMYKTGDLVRWLNDGNLEFLGRIDEQVKIHGFRIELGEVALELMNYAQIMESVVDVKEQQGDKYLVAYYVSDQEIEISDLKDHLSSTLPNYMIPTYYVHMSGLPLTINDKLDKKLLPEPPWALYDQYVGPKNQMEEKLVQIWSKVLKIDTGLISANKSFFELGGNSLKAEVLVHEILKQLSVDVTLREIFNKQNIKGLSDYIITIKPPDVKLKDQTNVIDITI